MSEDRPNHAPNLLLDVLPEGEQDQLRACLRSVHLTLGEVLYHEGESIERLYFPETSIVSVVNLFRDGGLAEVATVGREGAVGADALLSSRVATHRALVQMQGSALTVSIGDLQRHLAEHPGSVAVFNAYIQAFLGQVMQTVACNSAHSVEERCARWLLMSHDRSGADTFPLTQEFLAQMLNVHRPTVSVVARAFQTAGLIRYSRGAITVVDRAGLEEASCECYEAIREHFGRRLPYRFSGRQESSVLSHR